MALVDPKDPITERVMRGVSSNSPLPPSVETAYYRKCIELKRRINEIEENNDILRVRKTRVERAVLKLRLERTIMLERLGKNMELNVDESDRSTSPPRTPQEKPLRSKRGHGQRSKNTPPPSSSGNRNNMSPAASQIATAGPLQTSAYLPQPTDDPSDAAANRINTQFFNTHPEPPHTAPRNIAAAPINGTVIQPVPAPVPAAAYAYDPTQEERRENGEATQRSGFAAVNGPVEGGQNGQSYANRDTEMGDADHVAPGAGFTAVNR